MALLYFTSPGVAAVVVAAVVGAAVGVVVVGGGGVVVNVVVAVVVAGVVVACFAPNAPQAIAKTAPAKRCRQLRRHFACLMSILCWLKGSPPVLFF